ncbi:MAG: bifunctional pyr operon transcriptional regulator/uracil phosphoribosyltransferase PyrR [Gammaproteobacteria bacterium]|nr:bifunctional pyr operon transcriptional regulator/uracil phosphoribosyltransferase PyrR [Gammaproteobacteria bacterium]NIR83373.1 bifunctional pyr operon transcriptional regulator/uracil phosphoribosyltransferase PyrR [Gammaproteobacteria bacterium]NIR91173.1 bifunctional pyr operon transcriptional regulator/uracil phosphoribosyltransferase PyrR [Gammaproteobacteria bacterium]NIU04540.1 bifunctional pyr operon transcriptional regulator/uracil phosphoribosyltransferase PyrR [Gammaproteobacteri
MSELPDVERLLSGMAERLTEYLRRHERRDPLMIGIRTGGVWVAERLQGLLGLPGPLGTLNINFYRDDFTRIGLHPRIAPSDLPFEVDGRHIVLVDDVLYTGRTIRAALNEIFDYGRPASVTLGTLVERDGRELPIQADVLGQHVRLEANESIKLTGPEPLALEVRRG